MIPVHDVKQLFPLYFDKTIEECMVDHEQRLHNLSSGWDGPLHPLDIEPMPDESLNQFLFDSSTEDFLSSYISQAFIEDALSSLADYQESLNKVIVYQEEVLHALRRRHARLEEGYKMLQRLGSLDYQPFPPAPLDVVRSIIELSASTSKEQVCSLSLVSKEVCFWVEPYIFGQIDHLYKHRWATFFGDLNEITPYNHWELLPSEPLSPRMSLALRWTTVYTLHVEHWGDNFRPSMKGFERLLIHCPKLRTLWMPHMEKTKADQLEKFFPASLTQLACSVTAFQESDDHVPFNSRIYNHVTHLYLDGPMGPAWDYTRLSQLENLTHMRMKYSRSMFRFAYLREHFFPRLPSSMILFILELDQLRTNDDLQEVRDGQYDRRILIGYRMMPEHDKKVDESTLLRIYILPIPEFSGYTEDMFGLHHPDSLWNRGLRLLEDRNQALGL